MHTFHTFRTVEVLPSNLLVTLAADANLISRPAAIDNVLTSHFHQILPGLQIGAYLRHHRHEMKKGSPLTLNTESQCQCLYASMERLFVCTLHNVDKITSKRTSYTRQGKPAPLAPTRGSGAVKP